MIELKFTVDEEFTEQDLRSLTYSREYICALSEIKDLVFRILDNGYYSPYYSQNIDLDESSTKLVEYLHRQITEICSNLPKDEY